MKQWTGKVKDTDLDSERGDADITTDNGPFNEWLAAQGLLCLSDDQPKEGYCYIVGLGLNCKFIDLLFKRLVIIFIKISFLHNFIVLEIIYS